MIYLMIRGLAYNTNDIKTCFALPVKLLHIEICGTPQKLLLFWSYKCFRSAIKI